jgi:hypothetical protein
MSPHKGQLIRVTAFPEVTEKYGELWVVHHVASKGRVWATPLAGGTRYAWHPEHYEEAPGDKA